MRVVTFYSYKGGVGRTLACANFGLYLAKAGQNVVLADMDFEAPGLDSKFAGVNVARAEAGLLDQFYCFQERMRLPDIKLESIDLSEDIARFGGKLHLIPAGNYLDQGYYPKLANLRWREFTSGSEGVSFCLDLLERIEAATGADVLVIDSRTGLTEIGGLCTQAFPDSVLLFTCASNESMSGTRRIHERIANSPIIKSRSRGRTEVDLRVVVSRVPRPENLEAFDSSMRERLGIQTDRLYYLFDQRDMSIEEYLALDRFGEEHPAILDDYVELFASFEPEATMPYVQKRLGAFREELTRRSQEENDRIIKELVTLFPLPDVLLEAAHYYRLTKEEEQSLAAYLRYLQMDPLDMNTLAEFATLCESMPETNLRPAAEIVLRLRAYGPENMSPRLLSRFTHLSQQPDDLRQAARAIEMDSEKILVPAYREVYFRALSDLEDWHSIVSAVSERDVRSNTVKLLVAGAMANMGDLDAATELMRDFEPSDPKELNEAIDVLSKIVPDADPRVVHECFPEIYSRLRLRSSSTSMSRRAFRLSISEEAEEWVRRLQSGASRRQA